jgi:hypothetical protein
MSAADKLHHLAELLAAGSRARSHSAGAEPSQSVVATPTPEAEREKAAATNQPPSPLAGLDLDTAIRFRWVLRDIKAKRTKLTPVNSDDLNTLIEVGLVEMRDDVPVLTKEGHRAID